LRFLAVVLLCLAPGLAAAQVYKCVDKEGRVKYTQTKPKDAECSGSVPSAAPPPAEGYVDPLKNFAGEVGKAREADAKVRQDTAQQQAQKDARCAQWRQRLTALERASQVFTTDEKGERHYQSAEQNDQLRAEARQGVATECS
jgi:hypothetical protein